MANTLLWKKIMANSLYQSIISIPELSREELELIVQAAGQLKAEPNPELIKNKVVASCFYSSLQRELVSLLKRQFNASVVT